MSTVLLIILAVVVILVIWFIVMYNGLVDRRNQVENAWSQIDVQLKRRHDLIPNLIETVKGYMTHEREVLENVTKARSGAISAQSVGDKARAEGILGGALSGLMVAVEAYPNLRANENFLALQEELTSTENKISFSRQNYNDQVLSFNNKIQMFPSNIVARMFSFKEVEYFEIQDVEKEVPKVSFK